MVPTLREQALAEAKSLGDDEGEEPQLYERSLDHRTLSFDQSLPESVLGYRNITITGHTTDTPAHEAVASSVDSQSLVLRCDRVTKLGMQNQDRHPAPAEKPKRHRRVLRERQRWSDEETQALLRGVAIFGIGKWKKILDHHSLDFHIGRTHIDLKDRFRTLFPKDHSERWKSVADPSQLKNKCKGRDWKEIEDEQLMHGFHKHGFNWQAYTHDNTINLPERSAANIRDRFRWRFADLYNAPEQREMGYK